MKLTLNIKNLSKEYKDSFGEKASFLGELYGEVRIPRGYVIIGQELIKILDKLIGDKIDQAISLINFLDDESVQYYANLIQRDVVFLQLPKDVEYELLLAYKSLGIEQPDVEQLLVDKLPLVAVRTSFPFRLNLPRKSLQRVNYLNIFGEERYLKAVKTCLASLFLKDMLKYYKANSLSWRDMQFSIVVQEMINAQSSGRAMSYIPKQISNEFMNKDNVIIMAVFGLGEAISNRLVKPDVYVVDTVNYEVVFKHIGSKLFAYALDTKRMKTGKVELGEKGKQPVLNEKQIREIARITKRIKNYLAREVIVEWALLNDVVYIVQVVPGKEIAIGEIDTKDRTDMKDKTRLDHEESHQQFTKVQQVDNSVDREEKNEAPFSIDDVENPELKEQMKIANQAEKKLEKFSHEETIVTKDDYDSKPEEKSIEYAKEFVEAKPFNEPNQENELLNKEELDINEILEIYDKTINDLNTPDSQSNESIGRDNAKEKPDELLNDHNMNVSSSFDDQTKNGFLFSNFIDDAHSPAMKNENEENKPDEKSLASKTNDTFLLKNAFSMPKETSMSEETNPEKMDNNKSTESNVSKETKNDVRNIVELPDTKLLEIIEVKIKKELARFLNKNLSQLTLSEIAGIIKSMIPDELYDKLISLDKIIQRDKIKNDLTSEELSFAYSVLTTIRRFVDERV